MNTYIFIGIVLQHQYLIQQCAAIQHSSSSSVSVTFTL